MTRPMTKIVTGVLVGVLVLFQFQLWLAKGGILGVWHMKNAIALQTAKNDNLSHENNNLRMEINKLKKGTFSVEEHARSGLGMIKEGEVFYRTVEKKNNEGMKE